MNIFMIPKHNVYLATLRGDTLHVTSVMPVRASQARSVRPCGHRRRRVLPGLLILMLVGCSRATPTPRPTPVPTASPTSSATPSVTPTATPSPTPTFPADALVQAKALNVRAGPNTLHPALQVVHHSTPLAIRGRNDDGSWLAVRSPAEAEGWVSASFVTLRRAYETIPIVPTPSPPPTPSPTPIPIDPSQPIVLVPPAVAQGDPFLVRARAPGAAQVIAALDEQAVELMAVAPDTFAGVLAAPPSLDPGQHAVHITAINSAGEPSNEAVTLLVHDAHFGAETIVLGGDASRLLDPALREAETQRLASIWAVRTPEKLWSGAWRLPADGAVSSAFGTRRNYNQGTISAWHTGVDFRGGVGTPVYASARGRVVLAEPLAARGNTVWLDHGWGVYSGYFHLMRIAVMPETDVLPGDLLGTIGATGTATGPHLHWEVRVGGIEVQPMQWVLRDVGALP